MYRRVFLGQAIAIATTTATLLFPAAALAKPSEHQAKKHKRPSKKSQHHPNKDKIATKTEDAHKHHAKKSQHDPQPEPSASTEEPANINQPADFPTEVM
jgi:hypothetical protein